MKVVPGSSEIEPVPERQMRPLTASPFLVYVAVPPVTFEVTLYSVLPTGHLFGVTWVAVGLAMIVVFPLGAHLVAPPFATTDDFAVADLYWELAGVQPLTVVFPEIVPFNDLQATVDVADAVPRPIVAIDRTNAAPDAAPSSLRNI